MKELTRHASACPGWDQQQSASAEPDPVPYCLRERPWLLCGHLQPRRPELLSEGVPQRVYSRLSGMTPVTTIFAVEKLTMAVI